MIPAILKAQLRGPGITILNLGCGTKTSPLCVNIDWSIYLRLKRNPVGSAIARRVLKGERLANFLSLSSTLIVHDLRRGIPASSSSVDAVYHSHVLEHIGRDYVPTFLGEILRVLKPGGVHRVVVPDWERMARDYIDDVERSQLEPSFRDRHEQFIEAMIEQIVRTEAHGTTRQGPIKRRLERILLGDARRRGEVHRWMYDRISLEIVLLQAGFADVQILDFTRSAIPNWEAIGLDREQDGSEYKPGSLYVEAVKR